MSFRLYQRDIPFKYAILGGGILCRILPRVGVLFEFVPGFVSFVALRNICDVFGIISTVSREVICGTCPSFFYDCSSGEFLRGHSCHTFILEVRSLSRGGVKAGPVYLLL